MLHHFQNDARAYYNTIQTRIAYQGNNIFPWTMFNNVRSTIFFSYSVWCRRPSFLSLLVMIQLRGHIAGPSHPISLRFVPCILSREDSLFFHRRLVSNCAYPRLALSAVDWGLFLCKYVQNLHTAGFELPNQHFLAAFEGNHLTSGATGIVFLRQHVIPLVSFQPSVLSQHLIWVRL